MSRTAGKRKSPEGTEQDGWSYLVGQLASGFAGDLQRAEGLWQLEERAADALPAPRSAWERESLTRLQNELEEVLFDCRCLAAFERWLAEPGRRFLFDRFCRRALVEWPRSLEPDRVPSVFRTGSETCPQHLEHCPFCRLARRRAEGRRRMQQLGLPQLLRGDELIEQLACRVLATAFFQARAPEEARAVLTPGDRAAPASLSRCGAARTARQPGMLVEMLLEGGLPDAEVEINIFWEPAGPADELAAGTLDGRGPANRLAFPHPEQPDALLRLDRQGAVRLAVRLPVAALEHDVVLRYCGRRWAPGPARWLISLDPPAQGRLGGPPPAEKSPGAADALLLEWPEPSTS